MKRIGARRSRAVISLALVVAFAFSARAWATDRSQGGPKEFNSCRKLPAGKRVVKLNLKPDTELGELVAWISSITCKSFIMPSTISSQGKKVTIVSPQLITPEEAYRLFLDALDSVGLTVYREGRLLHIIETAKAKTSPIPLVITGSDR